MPCEYCLKYGEHDPHCPNYIPSKTVHYCSICKEGIYGGEKYIENNNGDYAHWECIDGLYSLADFLEIELKEMEDDDEFI